MSSAEPRAWGVDAWVVDAWVVDAWVAFGWFAQVPYSERAVALLDAQPGIQLIAPDLMLVELLNAGWKAQRQGAIREEQFLAIGELAPSLFSELVPAATLLASAQRWCQRLDHPAYDCLYLALAELRSAVLLTQGSTPAENTAGGSAGGGVGDGDRGAGACPARMKLAGGQRA